MINKVMQYCILVLSVLLYAFVLGTLMIPFSSNLLIGFVFILSIIIGILSLKYTGMWSWREIFIFMFVGILLVFVAVFAMGYLGYYN